MVVRSLGQELIETFCKRTMFNRVSSGDILTCHSFPYNFSSAVNKVSCTCLQFALFFPFLFFWERGGRGCLEI